MAEQTTYQVLYWREIPAQIRVYVNSRPKSYQLPERFQLKIDRIAMEEGLANSDAYLEQWRWTDKATREGEPEKVAQQLIEELSSD